MSSNKFHLQDQPIPDGFQIFEDRLSVSGISFHRDEALAFAESKNVWLELEREADNKHDKNAIKIIGCSKGFFGTKRRLIGYVPKDVAKNVVERGFWEKVKPRLLKTYPGDDGYVEVLFQLLGPKGQKYQFDPPKVPQGRHFTDYVERVKQLKAEDKTDEAAELLLKLVAQTEKEASKGRGGVAPWYYEQLAVIYRKEKRLNDEVEILERYEKQPKAPGAGPVKLAERLVKARQLREKQVA